MASLAVLTGGWQTLAGADPAIAARGHVFGKAFGGEELLEPGAMAVNEATGNVYVVDDGHKRVVIFDPSGAKVGEFNGSGTLPGEGKAAGSGGAPGEFETGAFTKPEAIAVDNSCVLRKLTEKECEALDPSAGDVYLVDGVEHKVIDKYTAGGEYVGQVPRSPETEKPIFLFLEGLAVDPQGGLQVLEQAQLRGSKGEQVRHEGIDTYDDGVTNSWQKFTSAELFPFDNRHGLAVDSKGDFFARLNEKLGAGNNGGNVVEFGPDGKLLNQVVCNENLLQVAGFGVASELTTDDVYIDNVASISRCDASGTKIEELGEGVLTPSNELNIESGIAVDATSGTVYAADGATNVVDAFPLEPPGTPKIEPLSISNVTASNAVLGAVINPRSEASEGVTSYHLEYGRCASLAACATSGYEASVPVPEGKLTADFEAHSVSLSLAGLAAHTVYHARMVARNDHGTSEGQEKLFTTQGSAMTGLPDGRAWELVSPPDKHGALLEPIGEQSIAQASASGSAITYQATAPTEDSPQGNTNFTQVVSSRGQEGWSSVDLALPHQEATGLSLGLGEEYRFFSADLSEGVLQPFAAFDEALSPAASAQTAYLHRNFSPGGQLGCAGDCFAPLVTGCPAAGEECPVKVEEAADVPPGTEFGVDQQNGQTCPPRPHCGPEFLGATATLSHVVLRSRAPLTAAFPAAAKGLYEWSASGPRAQALQLVSVLPNGQAAAASPRLGFEARQGEEVARHAVSEDGVRVFWSEEEGHLYLRDTARQETVLLDAVQGGSGEGPADPAFQVASSDGGKVFFTDGQRLTANAGASGGSLDLYECEIVETAGHLACALSDLTPANGEEGADVRENVIGASEDGSYVYFVANGALAPGGIRGNCVKAHIGNCNLYVIHDGETRLVAVLSGADFANFESFARLANVVANVSSDGRWLVFMSQRPLNGYDNVDAVSGHRDEEVYLFDATRPVSEGNPEVPDNPACVSCVPTGARPHGVEYNRVNDQLVGGDRVWEGSTWLAANVPGWTAYRIGAPLYHSRDLFDDGRLFFNSSDALVPQDTNANEDVYEFEPPGVGSCTAESASFSESTGGCVALISSGKASSESAFLDASENGDDVFFLTPAQLVARDTDTGVDLYDAHVCSATSPCPPPPPPSPPACEGDACQSPGSVPTDPTPGSLTFNGPENLMPLAVVPTGGKGGSGSSPAQVKAKKLAHALKQCGKLKSPRRRALCRKQAKRRFGTASGKRASHGRTRH